MAQSDKNDTQPSGGVALIVGGGPGISSSCARLFAKSGMRVGVAARNPDKPVLQSLEKTHGVRRYACDATEPAGRDVWRSGGHARIQAPNRAFAQRLNPLHLPRQRSGAGTRRVRNRGVES